MPRTDPSVLDSWLNGSLDGDAVTELAGRQVWRERVQGMSLLGHAVVRNRLDLVSEALDQGADVNLPDQDGVVPVRMAVFKRRDSIFRRLAGADDLNRTAGTTAWRPGDDPSNGERGLDVPLFFPPLAFDLARYGTVTMAAAWHRGPEPGWERVAPLWVVLDKRNGYHSRGHDTGHALDAALLFNNPSVAGWLFEHTGLNPSPAVLQHGLGYNPAYRDEPPLAPHPTLVAIQALRKVPLSGEEADRLGQRLVAMEIALRGSKTPWTLANAVTSLVEAWRLHASLKDNAPTNGSAGQGRRRL